jgi:hypothetical protein
MRRTSIILGIASVVVPFAWAYLVTTGLYREQPANMFTFAAYLRWQISFWHRSRASLCRLRLLLSGSFHIGAFRTHGRGVGL